MTIRLRASTTARATWRNHGRRFKDMKLMKFAVRPVLLSLLLILVVPVPAGAAGPTVSGAGSTWSEIALQQWRSDVAQRGLSINYQGVGSSAGRQFYIINQVDFAVSEIPFEKEELDKLRSANRSFQYLPVVAGGTSLMYNLTDGSGQPVTNLQLSSKTIAGIFTGKITKWNDPAITKDNFGRKLPGIPIVPVIRSDGSGTSAQFSAYLHAMESGTWAAFARERGIPNAPTSFWPNFPGSVAQRGSDGIANYVNDNSIGQGAIGYVEAGYALARGRPVASVKNGSGQYSQPTAANVAIALSHASFNGDGTQNLSNVYRAPEKYAYPISSYSYMITPTRGFDPAKGEVLGNFIIYFACDGQQQAEVLGYSPLPPNLVRNAFAAVNMIPGAPSPPSLSNCNNPTLTGEFKTGGGDPPTGGIDPPEAQEGVDDDPTGPDATASAGPQTGETAGPGAENEGKKAAADKESALEEVIEEGEIPTPAAVAAAFDALKDVEPESVLPLSLAGLAVVLIAFGPMMVRPFLRRRRLGSSSTE